MSFEYCKPCNNTGKVSVPNVRDFLDGVWKGRYTMVVACGCPDGKRVYSTWLKALEAMGKKSEVFTFEEYEFLHPDWHEQMEEKKRRQLRDLPKISDILFGS